MAGAMTGSNLLEAKLTNKLVVVSATINNKCNLTCPHCYLQYDGDAVLEIAEKTVEALFYGDYKTLSLDGKEPTLSPHVIKHLGVSNKELTMITNGIKLDSVSDYFSRFKHIDVSLDGGPESYSAMRHSDFAKVDAAAKLASRETSIRALHTLHSGNVSHIADMVNLGSQYDKIIFSPYVVTQNDGTNSVSQVNGAILENLANSKDFFDDPRTVFLVTQNNFHCDEQAFTSYVKRATDLGLGEKMFVLDKPLEDYGYMRVTYDDLALTPKQALHTSMYADAAIKINSSDLEDVFQKSIETRDAFASLGHQ